MRTKAIVKAAKKRNRIRRRISSILSGLGILFLVAVAGLTIIWISARRTDAQRRDFPVRKYYTSITVHQGDSLWTIASEHMTPEYEDIYEYMNEVIEINQLKSDFLDTGSRLCIPYYTETA